MFKEWSNKATITVNNSNATQLTDYQKQLYIYPNSSVPACAGKSITTYGDAKQVTTIADPFGGNTPVGYFDGTGDYLTSNDSPDWYFNTNDFTIETNVYFTTSSTSGGIIAGQYTDASNFWGMYAGTFSANATTGIGFGCVVSGTWVLNFYASYTFSINTWYHIVITRSGSTWQVFVNGNPVTKTLVLGAYTGSIFDSSGVLQVGNLSGAYVQPYFGYQSEFRISNIARYTTAFTPPTTRFTPDTNTKLLLHMNGPAGSNMFIDSSGAGDNVYLPGANYDLSDVRFGDSYGGISSYWLRNNGGLHRPTPVDGKTVTANGDVKQILPFPGAGIGVFDGTGDYLSAPAAAHQLGTDNFTIECWYRKAGTSGNYAFIFGVGNPVFTTNCYSLNVNPANDAVIRFSAAWDNGGTAAGIGIDATYPTDGLFHHVAVTRENTTIKIYIDGILISSGSVGSSFSAGTGLTSNAVIGTCVDQTTYLNANLSELRISNIARYTGPFVPQRSPFTPDANTKLLLHFAPTGTTFTDSSPSPKTITAYGDVKCIASPVTGAGIAYFDGTGDYLTTSNIDFSLTDLSVAMWIYLPSTTSGVLFANSTINGHVVCYLTSNRPSIIIYGDATDHLFGNTLTTNTWHYLVFVKSGLNVTLYTDGSLISTVTLSSNPTQYLTQCSIGSYNGGALYLTGYLSEYIIKYSSVDGTIIPTTPSIPDQYTKLLLHFDNWPAPTTFLDDSSGKYEAWVKVPMLPASSSSNMNIYWGKSNVTTTSNGDATFPFFDHFLGDTINANKWITELSSGSVSLSNSICTLTGATSAYRKYYADTKYLTTQGYILDTRAYVGTDAASWGLGLKNADQTSYTAFACTTAGVKYYAQAKDSTETLTARSSTLTSWSRLSVYRLPNSVLYYENNALMATVATNVPTAGMVPYMFRGYVASTYLYIDWVLVRKYAPTDPSLTLFSVVTNTEPELTGNYPQPYGPQDKKLNRKSYNLKRQGSV